MLNGVGVGAAAATGGEAAGEAAGLTAGEAATTGAGEVAGDTAGLGAVVGGGAVVAAATGGGAVVGAAGAAVGVGDAWEHPATATTVTVSARRAQRLRLGFTYVTSVCANAQVEHLRHSGHRGSVVDVLLIPPLVRMPQFVRPGLAKRSRNVNRWLTAASSAPVHA
jgi:hypothetical protein